MSVPAPVTETLYRGTVSVGTTGESWIPLECEVEVKEGKGRYSDWAGTQTLITPKGRATFRLLCCNPA